MTTGRNLKSVLIAVVLILGTLTTASLASSLPGGNSIPSVRTVHALPGPPLLGVDCALGASADSPNPFPTPITTKDSDGVSDTSCQWAGDFDGDPAATFDPLVSDSPELASSGLGGGFIANVIYTNMNNTINAFDITVNYNPAVLDFVQFDQTGLLFGGNVNCPPSTPSCTLQLAASVDRVSGVVRLAQAVEQTTVGPGATNPALNVNAVTFFRMRFDVVGAGATSLTFGRNIITFAVGVNTGPESHSTQNSAFSTESLFQLTNGVVTGSFNESWTFSPNPEVPFAPLMFSAAAASCSFCTAPFTYQWAFSSFDSSGYVAKVNATGQTVSVTAPPQAINRVTLTVTDSAAHSVTAVRRLPIAAAAQGPATAAVGVVSAPFKSGYLGGVSAECSGSTCTGTGSTGFTGTWRFCPGSALVKTVCSNPNAAASADPASIAGISWLFAGLYTTVFSVTDSGPSQTGGPQTATQNFPIYVTGTPVAISVAASSNATSISAGRAVNVTAVTTYTSTYPLSFRAALFAYDFNWGDQSPDTVVASNNVTSAVHTYAVGGSFIVRVTAQEQAAAAPTSIKENGYSQLISVFDYSLLSTPNQATVSAGGSTTASVSATLIGGPTQSVTFSATGLPAGVSTSFSPTACSPTCSTTMTITTTSAVAANAYPFTIVGTATGGLIRTAAFTLTVTGVSFTVTINCPTTGTVGTAVTCTATSTGGTGTVTFSWTATGGSPASGTGASFSTTYNVKGSKTISVTGTDSATPTPNTQTKSSSITINPLPVTVTPTVPATGTVGTAVSVSATASGGTSPYTFSWSFGDGTAKVAGATATHTYTVKGTYTVRVNATDSNAVIASASSTITIAPLTLAVTPTVPTTGTVGTAVSVSATASGGTSPYTFSWNFGDGTANVAGATASHTYLVKGTFTVRVNATDTNAKIASASSTITIAPLTLTVTATVPATGTVGTAVSVSASASGGTSPYTFSWSFGDGTAKVAGATATHTYTVKGTYTVRVNATDTNAKIASASSTITIAPLTLTVTPTVPTTGTVGNAVSVSATASGGTSPYTFSWNFGDGTANVAGATATHTYTVKGTYT